MIRFKFPVVPASSRPPAGERRLGIPLRQGLAAGLLVLAGCSLGPKPDPSRFYVLTSMAESGAGAGSVDGAISVGLGPVGIPSYLGRLQMVRRVGPNRIELSEYDRWVEPLEREFVRVIAENLSAMLRTDRVHVHPWYGTTELDYTVQIEVLRFERDTVGNVRLLGRWVVRDGESGERLRSDESDIREPAASPDAEASVAAQSRALAELSRRIADVVRAARRRGRS